MYKAQSEMNVENNNGGQERRAIHRRVESDRRNTIRFGDVLGRRSGVDRRVTSDYYMGSMNQQQ